MRRSKSIAKNKDFFGFNKAINCNKLKDPKVLKELEKIFEEKKLTSERASKPTREQASEQAEGISNDTTR